MAALANTHSESIAHTCCFSHHFQVNAFRLILKLLQFRKSWFNAICDLQENNLG